MKVEEITNELNALAYRLDSMRRHQATTEGPKTSDILRKAAAILRACPNAKPNDPLTLDELRELPALDWVWVELLFPQYGMDTGYYIKQIIGPDTDNFGVGYPRIFVRNLPYTLYGNTWLAYRRKPEEDAHGMD